jgi:uncharacterized protein YfkK (UPF0435 family)
MRKSTLNRMLELSNIKTLNEDKRINLSNFDLVKESVNGKTYAIVRENKTYHIKEAETKETLSESDFDYVGGVANKTKKSFTSFSEATRKLNFMFEEINNHYDVESTNILESEDILSEKKFVLKLNKKKTTKPTPVDEPSPEEEFDFGGEEESTEGGEEEFDFDSEEGGEEEFDFDSEEGGEDVEEFETESEPESEEEFEAEEEELSDDEDLELEDSDDEIKDIQSTTGKLGQQLRDVEDISSDMQKWVAKSVLSALDLDTMDSEDKKDIIRTVKKKSKEEEPEETESSEEEFDFEEMEESYDNHMGDDYEDGMDGMDKYNWDGVSVEDDFPSYEDVYDETEETELVDEDEERYIKPRKRRNTNFLPGFHKPNLRNQEYDSEEYDSHMSEKSMEEIDAFLMDMEETGIIEPSNDYDSYMDETTVVQGNSGEEEAGEEGNYNPNRAAYESEDKGEDTEIGGDEDDKVADPDDKNVEDKLLLDIEEDMGPEEMDALYGPNTKKYNRSNSSRAMRQASKDISTHYNKPAAPGYDLDPVEKWAKHKLPYDTEFMGEGDYMTEDHLNDQMETYEQEKAYEDVETVVRRYGMDVELREKATSEDPEESLIYLDIVDGDAKLLVARINSVGDIEVGEMRGNKFTGEPLDSVEDFIEIFGEDLTKKEKQKLDMEESIEMSPAPQRAPEKEPSQPDTKPGRPEKTPGKDRPSRRPFTAPPSIDPNDPEAVPGPKAKTPIPKWGEKDKMDKEIKARKDNEKWSWEKDNEDIEFE